MQNNKKRIFFNDPIQALYMMKEFGVKFEKYDWDSLWLDINFIPDVDVNYHIDKESESYLAPIKGDLAMVGKNDYGTLYFKEDGWTDFEMRGGLRDDYAKTIMRDGKHFFMPEVEDGK